MSRKAKFLDSYEKRLVNEFKLTLMYAGNCEVFRPVVARAPGADPSWAVSFLATTLLGICLMFLNFYVLYTFFEGKYLY